MKLDRIQFNQTVFDPKTSRGADNNRTFFTVRDGYEIDLDPQTGIVTVSCPNGRHNCVHVVNAKEFRLLEEASLLPLVAASPKFEMVKTAEGVFVMQPVKKPEISDPEDADAIVLPPRKRGRPKKIPAAA